ncbi:MAG: FimV/HubP family polar landmark protein, partial [Litorivicinus sp.]
DLESAPMSDGLTEPEPEPEPEPAIIPEADPKLDYLSDPIDGGKFSGRLDLASTYVEMGMYKDAAELLGDVEAEGDDESKARAAELRQRIQDESGQ